MAIAVTADGEIITRGGLPSCTCCNACECDPDQYEVCVRHFWYDDYENWEDLVLVGGLCAGSFSGLSGNGFTYTLEWDAINLRWTITDSGIPPYLNIDVWNYAADRCYPIGANIADSTQVVPEEFYVASWGACPTCSEETELCVYTDIYDIGLGAFVKSYQTIPGSLVAGFFTDGNISIWWDGVQWSGSYAAFPPARYGIRPTDRCDPSGLVFYEERVDNAPPMYYIDVQGF